MSRITLDSTLRAKLNGLNKTLEVCHESGETVGHFLPADVDRKLLYQLDRLAEMWNTHLDRADVAAASAQIERLLHRDPLRAGEARADGVRILIEPPLSVYHALSEPDLPVLAFAMWRWIQTHNPINYASVATRPLPR